MVKWTASTENGAIRSGLTDDGSWLALSKSIETGKLKGPIVSLRLDGDDAGATIDRDKDGYIVANKAIASLQGGGQMNLVGIGYWDKNADVGRIKWYNAKTMELQFTEARPTDKCGFFLIRNT